MNPETSVSIALGSTQVEVTLLHTQKHGSTESRLHASGGNSYRNVSVHHIEKLGSTQVEVTPWPVQMCVM